MKPHQNANVFRRLPRLLRRLTVLLAILVIAVGSGVPHAASAQPASAQNLRTLSVGVIAGVGSQTALGVQLAVARFNARGPITTPDGQQYKLAAIEKDANTPAEVASAIDSLKVAGAVAIFGPDIDELAQAAQNNLLAAGVPVFTAATSPSAQTTGAVYRTRASDVRLMGSLAQYLTNDLGKTKIAIFQGDSFVAQRVTLFTTSLAQLGKTPATTVLQVQGGALKDSARVLLGPMPDTVVAFGTAEQAGQLLRELRAQGYTGPFSYPDAAERAFINALPSDLRAGIIGVSNWTYSVPTTVTGEFVRDYVALFGEVPTGKSAAAYDAAGAVFIAAVRSGVSPQQLVSGLLALPRVESIQGHFNATLGTNELSADVYVFETGPFGAPIVRAKYDETGKTAVGAEVAPLPTLAPTAPPAPPTSAQPPTPQGVSASPKNGLLNVRSGPGTNYDRIGQLRQTDIVQVIGVSPAGDWLVISFAGGRGWIQGSLAVVNGTLSSVPIIEAPPSPTPLPATLTPTPVPIADLVPISVVINPPQPRVNQPFIASVIVQNRGGAAAGRFAVAASWQPGNVFASGFIDSLAPGATQTVNLNVPGVTGTGTFTVEVVVDLNNEINEGPQGKDNNKLPVQYTVIQ